MIYLFIGVSLAIAIWWAARVFGIVTEDSFIEEHERNPSFIAGGVTVLGGWAIEFLILYGLWKVIT